MMFGPMVIDVYSPAIPGPAVGVGPHTSRELHQLIVRCQSCCCIIVVTILVIFTLSLTKMYVGHDFQDEQNELTGIIFLVMLLFFVCLLLFLVRFSILFFRKRGRSRQSTNNSQASGSATPTVRQPCGADDARPSGSGSQGSGTAHVEPPPYHEALFLPAPPTESPPPAYDKLEVLIHKL